MLAIPNEFAIPTRILPLNNTPVSENKKEEVEAFLRQEIASLKYRNQELQASQIAPISLDPLDSQKSKSEVENILKQEIEKQKKRAEELRQEAKRRRQERMEMDGRLTSLECNFNAMDEQLDRIEVHQASNEESVQQVSQDIEEIQEENRELAQQTVHIEAQYREMGEQAESINQKQDIIQGEIQHVKVLHTSLEQQTVAIEQELVVRGQELNEIEQRQANIQAHLERPLFSQAQAIANRTQQLASQLISQSKQAIIHTAQRVSEAGNRFYSFCKNITKKVLKYIIQRISAFVKRIFLNPITWIALTILSYYIVRERTLLYIAAGILFYTLMAGRVKHWLIQP